MSSRSSQEREKSMEEEEKKPPNKIFVTNLDVETPLKNMEDELKELFSKYGELSSLVVKKSFNNQYSFAFIEFKEGEDASQAVNNLNNQYVGDKKMKVQLQDNARRRKGGYEMIFCRNQTCYVCGKPGHFARVCHSNKAPEFKERRDKYKRSRSSSEHEKKKKKRRHSSSSQSQSRKKKQKKDKKISKHKKKHSKKHKKEKNYSDSGSSN